MAASAALVFAAVSEIIIRKWADKDYPKFWYSIEDYCWSFTLFSLCSFLCFLVVFPSTVRILCMLGDGH